MPFLTLLRRSVRWPVAAVAAATVAAAGCSTESLLKAPDPDLITPESVNSPEGANAVYIGALDRFRNITGGAESSWLFGGLLADEWSSSSTFVQNDETDQRAIQENNSSITGMFRNLARVRTAANQAIFGLTTYQPTRVAELAEMYFARGFAEMQLAQDFCNGIPLSDGTAAAPVFGTPQTVAQVFASAIASYDSARALVVGRTDAASVRVERAARIGRARAQIGLGDQAAALATLNSGAAVPLTYSYDHTFAPTSGDNVLWSQPASAIRYVVGDSLEGNAPSTIPVPNVIGFSRAGDPRLPVTISSTAFGQDGGTFRRVTPLWARSTPIPVVNGIDARMIQAEERVAAGDIPGTMAILNALRAAPPTLGTVTPAAMAPLPAPASTAALVRVFFREKAFWTFSRGQRLGDMRRLIREYGLAANNVFATGPYYKGGTYGSDVNLPVPVDEQNNPNFTGCIDRNP